MKVLLAYAVLAALLLANEYPPAPSASATPAFTFLPDRVPSGQLILERQGRSSARAIPAAGVTPRPIFGAGLTLVKTSEGWVPHLYDDAASYCTIGFGHLVHLSLCNGTSISERPFLRGLAEPPQGTRLLVSDLSGAEYAVMTEVKVPVRDGQYAALTDFVFNVGSANFERSTLLKVVNAREDNQVPLQLRRWVYANGKPYAGLETRREREVALYFQGRAVPRAIPFANEVVTPLDVITGKPIVRNNTNRH